MFHKPLLTGALVLACAASAPATVIFSDNFDGAVGTNLNTLTTDVGGYTWAANTTFKADGSFTSAGNTDVGAALNLGATFFADQFAQGNTTLILTVTYSGGANNFAYANFTTDAWTTTPTVSTDFNFNAAAQGQGIGLGVEFDTIAPNAVSLYRDNNVGDGSSSDTRNVLVANNSLPQTVILTITAGLTGYSDSTITLSNGVDPNQTITGYDASAFRTFYLGVESGTGTKTANFDFVQLEAVPEPSIALLGGLGLLGLLRRRRA